MFRFLYVNGGQSGFIQILLDIFFLLDEHNNLTNLTFCLNNLIGGQCVKNINLELLSTAVVLHLLVFYVPIHKRERLHNVWKSQKKSHSTWRAKRATFTFWVDKSSLKMPKIVYFGEIYGQTVLPDWSILIGQKLVEMPKLKKFKCDIFGNFQTLWLSWVS